MCTGTRHCAGGVEHFRHRQAEYDSVVDNADRFIGAQMEALNGTLVNKVAFNDVAHAHVIGDSGSTRQTISGILINGLRWEG